jgi:hypothetical protein
MPAIIKGYAGLARMCRTSTHGIGFGYILQAGYRLECETSGLRPAGRGRGRFCYVARPGVVGFNSRQ